MSRRAISPRDHPAYRPKFRTLPDASPGGVPAAPRPSGAPIRVGSYPPPALDRPLVQSLETDSAGVGSGEPEVADPRPVVGASPARLHGLPDAGSGGAA